MLLCTGEDNDDTSMSRAESEDVRYKGARAVRVLLDRASEIVCTYRHTWLGS